MLAKEASGLPQEAPADVRTITRAVSRAATKAWRQSWPHGLFKEIWGDRMRDHSLAKIGRQRWTHTNCGPGTTPARDNICTASAVSHILPIAPTGVMSASARSARGRSAQSAARRQTHPHTCCYAAVSRRSPTTTTRQYQRSTDAAAGQRCRSSLGPRLLAPPQAAG